eukprot:1160515-Pelagomonas_calceolata.AAC.7
MFKYQPAHVGMWGKTEERRAMLDAALGVLKAELETLDALNAAPEDAHNAGEDRGEACYA